VRFEIKRLENGHDRPLFEVCNIASISVCKLGSYRSLSEVINSVIVQICLKHEPVM
jgi:hypothetical protein